MTPGPVFMKNIGTTLPIPRALLGPAHGFRVTVLRSALHCCTSPHLYEEQGEHALKVRNAPPTVKGAVGWARLKGLRHILAPTCGDLVDFRAAFSCLAPHTDVHLLPICPGDARRTQERIAPVLERLVQEGDEGDVGNLDNRVLGRLHEELARRQLQGCFGSVEWHRYLLALVDGSESDVPQADDSGDGRCRVAVLGYLAGLSDLYELVEYLGGRVVLDEWAELAAQLVLAQDPYEALSSSPWVLGLNARFERLKRCLGDVGAVILVTEPFCALAIEETWFRNVVKVPFLVLECNRLGALDAGQQLRLENFAGTVFGGRV